MADAVACIYAGMKTEQFKTAIAMADMFRKEFDKIAA
jgi:outer membrane protein assembly factor BamD (BamD/ComL family)